MNSLEERMYEADQREALEKARIGVQKWRDKQRNDFVRYLIMAWQEDFARELFWMDSLGVIELETAIIVPEQKYIFTPHARDTGGLVMNILSRKELSFLLQAFFPAKREREYAIDTLFYNDNFMKKTLTDVLDFMSATEELFLNTYRTKERILKIVEVKETNFEAPEPANDRYFTPISKPIDSKWRSYGHEVHKLRLEYAESLFCQTVALLANTKENHLWAMDPENFPFVVTEEHRSHIELIQSICELHRILEPDYPELHAMIEPAVAAWIMIYRGFSAHAHDVRESVHHRIETSL